ncbi:Transposon protein, putative, CACTA, En/Spm sub-class [Quillaja saponaria]|uniref:Transposon protein, putative, CACTA, En/Spm sub-class n=1 Tax=Quillaja saponaria TaxID=32244 RepID=A0AAD7LKA4_QUISA|nr:Transposon protein, putative, CACTA, En/Spm sub-class [Quillaja saponaria]
MVLDAAGPDFNWDDESRIREEPNCDAQNFYDLLKNADEPLWEGCDWHSRLSAVTQLLNCKSEFNMSESLYDRLISIIKGMLPKDEKLPENFYRSKQMVKKLGLGYEKIHVCPNDCMLYYGEKDKKLRECRICGHSRYQPKTRSSKIDVPYKILCHFPLAPRLQRLFMLKNTAQHMTWHDQRRANGIMIHPSDGEAWKHFDDNYPSFSDEPRNIRLGLATDGFCPFGHSSNGHSIWPVFVTPYNLPPNMCMKEQYLFLTLVIPGPKSPKQNLDIYLRPLIDDLKKLWNVGVNTYDAYRGENFIMRAALMWTISDFPAYGMLSGWSTHGNLACPYCMEQTKSFRLPHSHKQCWFDCHRQFLPIDHPFRKQKDKFKKNTTEKALPLPRLSGEEVWGRLRRLNQITFGNAFGKQIISGFGKQHNWAKISIFWELPYWSTNLIRHNLDVMHIEKNVFDNVFNTVMNMKGKTKDNPNGRMDLQLFCKRPELELTNVNGKLVMPKASYSLSKPQVKEVCQWIKGLRLPDGYASNLGRCVDMDESKLSGMKSHDCHVFMQRLIPIAFRDYLPKGIWEAFTELSNFFRDLCMKELCVKHMKMLEKNIVVTLCKLEKILVMGFFDSMEHLIVHIPYEAKVGGPVHYRWMYPFERMMFNLKKKARNKACVEGSICEAYCLEEISNFCAMYFESNVPTKLNRVPRQDDGGNMDCNGRLSVFCQSGRAFGFHKTRPLTDIQLQAAKIYVLLNTIEIEPYVSIHGSGSNASRDPPSMNQTSRTTRKSSQSSRAIPLSSQAGFALPRSSSQAGSALPRSSAQVGSTLPRSSQSTHADIPSSPGDRDVGHIMESSGHNSPLGTSGDLSTSRAPVIEPLVTRGYAHLDPPPTNPADRPLIRIRTDSEFDNPDTVRTIKSIIEAHMPGPIPVWSQYPRIARDLCYRQFLAHYRFNTEQEEKDGKIVFEKIAGRRYRDVLRDARAKAKIMCKTEDISKCEGWMPDWMTVENWRGLLQIWSSEQWKKRSKIGTQNRGLGEESIVRHAGGSISVLQHKEKLEEYIREVSEKYGEDSDAHPSFDPDIWLKVTGGVQKGGKVYGCGTPGAARALFGDKINSSRSSL